MTDTFTEYYGEYLHATYDCVDRIVLNAYYPLIQRGGGFRTWWRQLEGNDDNLDNTHLMRFAGHFARRVKAFAEKRNIPLVRCQTGERKDESIEQYLPPRADFTGLFCIFINRASASVMEVRKFHNGNIDIRKKDPWPYVNMYSFHIMDPHWGHLIIRFCPHPPFNAMIILNGHEYVERKARKAGIVFTKEDNCFTRIPNAAALAGIAETMISGDGDVGRLADVCERWIYSTCLCFALEIAEQQRTDFRYAYSVFQAEYSRNLLFTRGTVLDKAFDGVIERTRTALDIRSLKTIFGYQRRPTQRDRHGKRPRIQIVVEKPVYNLTVFKVHFGRLTIKMYSKGERVLRIEAIAHNTAELRCGKCLQKFSMIVGKLAAIVEAFMHNLHCVDVSFVDVETVESWRRPGIVGDTTTSGIDINCRRQRAVMQALLALSIDPRGITTPVLARKVSDILGEAHIYSVRQAAYDIRKFRGKNIVEKMNKRRMYYATPDGLRAMAAYLVLRDKVLIPILAGCREKKRKNRIQSTVEQHISNIRDEMHHIFNEYKIAA